MAMNLVEQQNVLRDLTDDMLQQAMQGGIAPPYLVLAEVNRRKDARERYAAQKAKYDANQATVAQDVMQQLAQATQAAQGAAPAAPMGIAGAVGAPEMPASSGGLDAAMPSEAPAFADGGPVMKYANGMSVINPTIQSMLMGGQSASLTPTTGFGLTPVGSMPAAPAQQGNSLLGFKFNYPTYNNPYASLMDLYQSQLSDLSKEREQARAMALIAAGTGMMQGGPNTLKNIGAAFGPALQGYQSNISSINQTQRDMLREQAGLQAQAAAGEMQSKKDFEDSMEGRAQIAEQLGMTPGSREYDAYVLGNQVPTQGKLTLKNVIDTQTGQLRSANYDSTTGKLLDPATGAEMTNVRELTKSDEAAITAKNKGQIADEKSFNNATVGLNSTITSAEQHIAGVDNALKFLDTHKSSVGDFKSMLKDMPKTDAMRFEGMLRKIESGAVTNMLQDLRAAAASVGSSGTGFGQLTEKELELLRQSVADLRSSNDPDTIQFNLNQVKYYYNDVIAKAKHDYRMLYEDMIKKRASGDSQIAQFIRNNKLDIFDPEQLMQESAAASGFTTPPLGGKDAYMGGGTGSTTVNSSNVPGFMSSPDYEMTAPPIM